MNKQEWLSKCEEWKLKWPVMQDEYRAKDTDDKVNLYAVLDAVNQFSTSNDILMGDAGSISYAGPVALNAKEGQRFIFSPAQADMGWALPASIGVSIASDQPIIAIIGDGSFMSNIQELAVVKQHNLNIKFVILNNDGYLSIKNTQSRFYEGRVHGTSSETGLWFPNFEDIATAFGLHYMKVKNANDLKLMGSLFATKGPMIIDCICLNDQQILPAQTFRDGRQAGLHDMAPLLDKEELRNELVVKELS
jgi:acetolactate synthase I/II/III large subunit